MEEPNTVLSPVLCFAGWRVGDEVGATRRLRLHCNQHSPHSYHFHAFHSYRSSSSWCRSSRSSRHPRRDCVGFGAGHAVGYLETSFLRAFFNDSAC